MRLAMCLVLSVLQRIATVSGRQSDPSNDQCTSDSCFQPRPGCTLSMAVPFVRRTPVSCQECLNLCKSLINAPAPYQCKSAAYDYGYQSCDIFAVDNTQFPMVAYRCRTYFHPTNNPNCASGGNSDGGNQPGVVPDSVQCKKDQTLKFVSTAGFVLKPSDAVVLKGLTQQQCVDTCKNNKDSSGKTIPCLSFDFDGDCKISQQAATPKGSGTLSESATGSYFEKLCIDSAVSAQCPGEVISKSPQYILVGYAQNVVTVKSFDECLQSCLNSQQLFGFKCQSAMYFDKETADNCILNSESKETKPDLFTQEKDNPVTYFQPNCNGPKTTSESTNLQKLRLQAKRARLRFSFDKALKRDVVLKGSLHSWTVWTTCHLGQDRTIRYQRCRHEDIRRCPREINPCDRHPDTILMDVKKRSEAALSARFSSNTPFKRLSGNVISNANSAVKGAVTSIARKVIIFPSYDFLNISIHNNKLKKICRCAQNICSHTAKAVKCDVGLVDNLDGSKYWCRNPDPTVPALQYC